MPSVHVIYHSGYGHTKVQAEAVQRGAASVDSTQALLWTTEEAAARIDELDSTDAIIFGAPTYMGSMSAEMKKFVEVAARKWFVLAWKDKVAGAFTNSSSFSGDKLNTLLGLVINAMQHGMIYVGLGMMPSADRPEDMNALSGPSPEALNRVGSFTGPMSASFQVPAGTAPGSGDLRTAEAYGKRIAEITGIFARGRGSSAAV